MRSGAWGKQEVWEVWEVWEDGEALILFPPSPPTPHTPSSPRSSDRRKPALRLLSSSPSSPIYWFSIKV
ncbi:MAG: hypothetical protein RMY29_015140 [Nostoc sp. CreGUA01]|nr:hypothetical protein [Nostoc sp. CreGUA01]